MVSGGVSARYDTVTRAVGAAVAECQEFRRTVELFQGTAAELLMQQPALAWDVTEHCVLLRTSCKVCETWGCRTSGNHYDIGIATRLLPWEEAMERSEHWLPLAVMQGRIADRTMPH